MRIERYRFHCTDGTDAVLDMTGQRLREGTGVRFQAERVARELMAACPGLDWSGWIVDVHDALGRRVLMLAFADVAVPPVALAA